MAMLLALHPLPGGAAEKGKVAPPRELTQLDREGEPLGMGGELKTASLSLSGKTSSCSPNECSGDYSLEIELRPVEEEFTGDPTHRSLPLKKGNKECGETVYPPINVAGLAYGTAYKWQAREKAVVYEAAGGGNELACKNPETEYSPWAAHGEGNAPSFVIPPLVARTTKSPTSAVKTEGSGSDGTANRLYFDDERYYRVWATPQAPYVTSWHSIFTEMDKGARNIEIAYKGFNSRRCSQTIDIWDWKIEEWTRLDAREAGEAERTIEKLVPPGDVSNYVSDPDAGEMRVRVRCLSDTLSFSSNGNMLNISYDQPLSPR